MMSPAPLRFAAIATFLATIAGCPLAARAQERGIPIGFTLKKPGFVTLVIEDKQGRRMRNLISETPFKAGSHTVLWDGLDDTGRVQTSPNNTFQIAPTPVGPGTYQVRGLVRPNVTLTYEFTVYNPGTPPWASSDPSSQWLANHTPPSDVLFLPEAISTLTAAGWSPGGQVLVCSPVTEGGSGLAWLDLDGKKRRGQMWVGGVWTGASCLARDVGPRPVEGVYAYTASAWAASGGGGYDGPKSELRLAELLARDKITGKPRDARMGQGDDRPLLTPFKPYDGLLPSGQAALDVPPQDTRFAFPDEKSAEVGGLAVYNGQLVASLPKLGQLLRVDARARRILGTIPLAAPGGLAFDAQGHLYALSGKTLVRFAVLPAPGMPGTPETIVSSGLDAARGLAVSGGEIFVSENGTRNHVVVYGTDGKKRRVIGRTGLPRRGQYDARQMHRPAGMALDSRGHLWVAEDDTTPKRVSIWNARTGQFVRAFYGPMEYGGGGTLDSTDKTRFHYGGLEFALDWKTGRSVPVGNPYQPTQDTLGLKPGFRPHAPEAALVISGHKYLTDAFNTHPTNGADSAALWRLDTQGVARPVAALGRGEDWPHAKLTREQWFFWTDRNGDGKATPNEAFIGKGQAAGITIAPDGAFVAAYLNGKMVRFRPLGIDARGIPRYDATRPQTLANGARLPQTSGGGQVLPAPGGWTVSTLPTEPYPAQASVAGIRNGVPLWTYPSLWPGLHPSHDAPLPTQPGQLIGTTRFLGGIVTPKGGGLGTLFAVNGNKGNTYLFTVDGLFVATLFADCRKAAWDAPRAVRGMSVAALSQQEENFWPTLTQTPDGMIYTVTGGGGGSIIRIGGLEDGVRLPPQTLTISQAQIESAARYRLVQEKARQQAAPSVLTVPVLATLPGGGPMFAPASFVAIEETVTVAALAAADRLYVRFRTGDPDLLRNAGTTPNLLFKTGGALDLQFDAQGQERLLVAQVNGQTIARLYRKTVPGTTEKVPFASPQRTVTFDRVDDVSAQVTLTTAPNGEYTLSVPLFLLGLAPQPGARVRGDIGILRGNGFQTLQRSYWHNKQAGITSDVPSEAELVPELWGTWQFTAPQ